MKEIITIKNLSKSFDNNENILNNINLTINKGEIVTIIGPSGSGKSTLLRCINLLNVPTSGEIFFNDISTGAHNDIEVATRIARLMVTEYGMSPLGPIQYEKDTGSVFLGRDYTSSQKNFSTQVAFEIDNAVRKIIDDAHEEAKRIIRERKEDVILLAETLLEQESITAEQIDYLLKHRTLKPEASLEKEEVKEIKEDDAKVEGTTTEE